MSTADETRPDANVPPVTTGKREEPIPLPPPRPQAPNADAPQHPALGAGPTAGNFRQVVLPTRERKEALSFGAGQIAAKQGRGTGRRNI
jgi:hypothetical protein